MPDLDTAAIRAEVSVANTAWRERVIALCDALDEAVYERDGLLLAALADNKRACVAENRIAAARAAIVPYLEVGDLNVSGSLLALDVVHALDPLIGDPT